MKRHRLVGLLGFLPVVATAQSPQGLQVIPESGVIANCNFVTGEFHFNCFPVYLGYLIQLAFAFGVGTSLSQIVWGGYEWAFAGLGGDTQGAKKRIQHAIIGLVVSVLAFLIVDTVVLNLLSGPST